MSSEDNDVNRKRSMSPSSLDLDQFKKHKPLLGDDDDSTGDLISSGSSTSKPIKISENENSSGSESPSRSKGKPIVVEESKNVVSSPGSSHMPEQSAAPLPQELLKTFYKKPGRLLIAGMVSWDLVAKRDASNRGHPNLYSFHKFTDMKYRLIVSSCSAAHSILISEQGEAYTLGRNNFGQLGFGDTLTRHVPELVPRLRGHNIIHAATGRSHSLFVTDTGVVYACGDNKSGQCGVKNMYSVLEPTRIMYDGAPIVKVGCGAAFSMILDCNGTLHSFGLSEYGQLGQDTKMQYTLPKISYDYSFKPKKIEEFVEKTRCSVVPMQDVEIVDFSCGNNHTVAIDSRKRAFSWGFGGFGRLGHAEQKDECLPRLIKYFEKNGRGVCSVHCGATYSLTVNDQGTLFLFGQTKRTGDANMYPKPVHDLIGWKIRSVGASNTSVVVAADDSLIAWGVSPTYGELGLGNLNKSSAQPKEVQRMSGMNITQVTMGYSHTLLLCDDESADVKAKLDSLPTFQP